MDHTINKLISIGLNLYEAKAYSVLLKSGISSASQISKIGKIPQGRIYNILESLIQKGFCSIVQGSVKKFKAVDPKVVMNSIIQERRKNFEEQEKNMLSVAEQLNKEFESQDDIYSTLDYIHIYTTRPSMINKFKEIVHNCKETHRTFNKPPFATSSDPSALSPSAVDAIKRGVRIKSIYEIQKNNLDSFIAWIKHFDKAKEEIRITEKLPLKMVIADNNVVMFTLHNKMDKKNNFTSVVIEHSDLTNALIELFDIYWERSMTLEEFLERKALYQ